MLQKGQQCGGRHYNGSSICAKGLKCTVIYKIDKIAVCKEIPKPNTSTATKSNSTAVAKSTGTSTVPKSDAKPVTVQGVNSPASLQAKFINTEVQDPTADEAITSSKPVLSLITDLPSVNNTSPQPESTSLGMIETALPSPLQAQGPVDPNTTTLWLGLILGITASIISSLVMVAVLMRTKHLKKKMQNEDLRWKNVIEDIRNSI